MYSTGIRRYWELRRNLKLPLSTLKVRQWKALCRIVQFAYDRVPFYRKLYSEAQFSPSDLNSPADLARIPTSSKALFQQAEPSDLIARGYELEKLRRKRTSGSTGSPLNVYYAPEDRILRTILHLRILFHNGMKLTDRMAHISDNRDVPDFRYSFQKLGFLAKDFVAAADDPQQQLENLARIQPDVIYSYASSMVLLSEAVQKMGNCPIKPRLIFTTGELLNPADRERINRTFSVKLRDIYGIVEMGDVAWECPELDGYHLNIDNFWVDLEKDGSSEGTSDSGKLIITNLHSFAMPIIRYEVGDIISEPYEEICKCGCTFPRLQVVQGRADDWLYTVDGKRISPLIFVIASIPGVQQYRMIQKSFAHLIVEILPGKDFSLQTLEKAREHVLEVMGAGMQVDVQRVDQIPKQSGKMRRVISELDRVQVCSCES
ncbi:MAG: hypothetical protein ABH878_07955 [bacterium]